MESVEPAATGLESGPKLLILFGQLIHHAHCLENIVNLCKLFIFTVRFVSKRPQQSQNRRSNAAGSTGIAGKVAQQFFRLSHWGVELLDMKALELQQLGPWIWGNVKSQRLQLQDQSIIIEIETNLH